MTYYNVVILIILLLMTSSTLGTLHSPILEHSKDLHVEAFVKDWRILQLNVTLLKPIDSAYDVNVASIMKSKNTSDHCLEVKHCRIHDVEMNQTSVTFPENNQYLTDHETCKFQNDCAYNITVRALNGKQTFYTVYRVKECVNGLCLCRNSDTLPKPIISPKMLSPKQLYFKWEIPTTETNSNLMLQFLTIDIYELRDCNLPWSEIKSIASFHEKLNNFGDRPIRKNDFTKELSESSNATCLRVRMTVVDSQNCHGPQVSVTVRINENKNNEFITFHLLLIIIAIIVTLATVMLIIYGVLWKSRKKNIVNYWRGLYHSVQTGAPQMIPMQENILYFEKDADWYEIPHSSIREIGREIGKGAFGRVFIARIADVPGKFNSQIVAIKKLKKCPTTDQLEEFLGEISTMKRVGRHPNVVRLLGFCTLEQPLMMIMEFVPCGDLVIKSLKYLRKVRAKHEASLPKIPKNNNSSLNNSVKRSGSNQSQILGPLGKYLDILHSHSTSSASETSSYITQPDSLPSTQNNLNGPSTSRPSFAETMYTNLTVPSNPELNSMLNTCLEYVVDHKELHNFAIQIARGMRHLQDLQITHRDLAARNILIDENKTLKISDFGLSRSGIYVNTKNKKVPLRWLSIEAMKDNLYSSKSDVWAFAILLWEIGTLGGFPYPTVSNHELLGYLKSGERLAKPENCSDTLYELMLHCWQHDPDDRPDFGDICRKLDPNKNKIYIDFSELDPNYVFPPTSESFISNTVNVSSLKQQ
ncbi:CLUMA_CG013168, isoform A [Clunio marinus]|uniref:CLUMA_CG013168, isoform A n=1 Tax=Clunio marinus TaxID=568069 RepID=A0A1J1IN15_9DIPT|nr:CLUMA_CG013168, isoform A [Clunio marinus]